MKMINKKLLIIFSGLLLLSQIVKSEERPIVERPFGHKKVVKTEKVSYSFITGAASTHYEAQRMAYNAAIAARMKVMQQTSRKNADGSWQVITKVSPK